MKSKLIIIGMAAVLLLSMVCSIPVNAEEADVTMDVYVETEGNVNASFNATAGGNVTYWIDGMEVKSEFSSIWEAFGEFDTVWEFISELESLLGETRNTANGAYHLGLSAYSHASDNYDKIMLAFTALLELNETTNKLQSELDDLNNTLNSLKDQISQMELEIQKLNETTALQQDEINDLKSEVNEINSLLGSVGSAGMILLVIAVIACCLLLLNRKYPFGQIMRNNKGIFKNGKKRKTLDFTRKSGKPKKTKSKSFYFKMKHIKRNKEKSPAKSLFSFLQVHK